jgi:hypothetical protein
VDIAKAPIAGRPLAGGIDILFTLPPGNQPCSLTGYPSVQAVNADGTTVRALDTLIGYVGGLRPGEQPPTIVLQPGVPAHALLEWSYHDFGGAPCTRHAPKIAVMPPNSTLEWHGLAQPVDTCAMEIHPVTDHSGDW